MRRDPFLALLLAAFAIACATLGARQFVDLGSIELALALEQQDMRLHHPHPPGFVLYVWLAQIVHVFVGDAFVALRVVALAFLLAAAYFVYKLAEMVHERRTASMAVLLFLSSPLVLFHAMTTSTYAAEVFVSALAGFLCLRACARRARQLRLEAYLLGLVVGLRQTVLLFALPLLLLAARRLRLERREALLASLAWILGTLCWLVPQLEKSGGLGDYTDATLRLVRHLFDVSPLHAGGGRLAAHLHGMATALLCGLGVFRVVTCLAVRAVRSQRRRASEMEVQPLVTQAGVALEARFLLVWILPATLAGLAYCFTAAGSALVAWPAACIGLARLASLSAHGSTRSRSRSLVGLVGFAWLVDLGAFFFVPASAIHVSESSVFAETVQGIRQTSSRTSMEHTSILQPLTATLFAGVEFFFDRTRKAEFDTFLEALRPPSLDPGEVLLIGRNETRAACYLLPGMAIVHADPVRRQPFLAYHDRRAQRIEATYPVHERITWLLVEGRPGEVRFGSPGEQDAPRPATIPLAGGLQALRIGSGQLDAWYAPEEVQPAVRLHLVRAATPDHKTAPEFERTSTTPSAW